jgi:hypothetical protein
MRNTFLFVLAAVACYGLSHKNLPAVDNSPGFSLGKTVAAKTVHNESSNKLTRLNFEAVVRGLYDSIGLSEYDLGYDIFRLGMIGYYGLESEGALNGNGVLTIIDFAMPSTKKRLYTIDLVNKKVKYHTYVAHGRNTGENLATRFSNTPHSNQSSLGFFVTGETYFGSKGYSLRLDGKERSFNDNVRSRAVVVHGADYVTDQWIKRYGRLGRSQGCPALPPDVNREVINTIRNGTAVFTYYPEPEYLGASKYLKLEQLFENLEKNPIFLNRRQS